MDGRVPGIVLALGAAVVGGPDALRLMLTLAGQSPIVDIAICLFVLAMFTAQLLGVAQLARFVRKPRSAGRIARRAPAMDLFAKTIQVVSVGVAFLVTSVRLAFDSAEKGPIVAAGFLFCIVIPLLCVWRQARNAGGAVVTASGTGAERFGKLGVAFVVTACLVVLPGGGLMSSARLAFDSPWKSPAFAAGFLLLLLLCIAIPLLRVSRHARNAIGARTTRAAYLTALSLISIYLLLFISFFEPRGVDSLRLFHGFTNTFFGLGAAAVIGTVLVLLARFSVRPGRNAAVAGSVVPAWATGAERFGKLREMVFLVVVVCIALAGVIQYAYAPPAENVCSA